MMLDFVKEVFPSGEHLRTACPLCSSDRKKNRSKDMNLLRKEDGAVMYTCHHCGSNGSVWLPNTTPGFKLNAVPAPSIVQNRLEQQHLDFLASRGISKATAEKMRLFSAEKFFGKLEKMADCIGFPYYRDSALVAVKYRAIEEKAFTQSEGGAHDFFAIDTVEKGRPIVIVEGEIDCLTLIEAGIPNVVSVPGGAPVKVSDGKIDPENDKKFSFIWNAKELLDAAPYIVLATDQDAPGQALAEELARRIGKEKCRVAKFSGKDLNEVYLSDPTRTSDPTRLMEEIISNAQALPVPGLIDVASYKTRLENLFANGSGKGLSTGYSSVDAVYTVAPAQLTVVTGYPSSGKSNFVDQIMVNLARSNDWKFGVCSFENLPEVHITRLMEIYTGKRFFDGKNRMSYSERDKAFAWVADHFVFIDTAGDEPNTLDSILGRLKSSIQATGIKGVVIDPYNYLDLNRDSSETDAISQMLTKIQNFVKRNQVHCWFVAHPSKITRSGVEQPRPDGMAIAGSMAWWAKTDNGITVHRKENFVEIAVWKCRYRWVGTQGETTLLYDKTAGTYRENLDKF
jgi:twinkle protein